MDTNTTCTGCKKFMLHLRTSDIKCQSCKTKLFNNDETVEQVEEIVHSSVCVGRGSAPHITATLKGASGDAKVTTANTAVHMTVINTQKEGKREDLKDDDINDFENLIKRKENFFSCQTMKSFQQVKQSLENKRWVIITGFPREGKTTLAANAADYINGREVDGGFYYKKGLKYCKRKETSKNSIIIIDDMFEENDESQGILRDIQQDLSSKESTNLYVVVCQLYNLKRARRYIKINLLDDEHVVNISEINSSQCTASELEPLLRALKLSLAQEHKITNGEYFFGLPGICLYYNSNRHFPKDVTFFSYPHSFFKHLIMAICKCDPKKRATFIMLLVFGGEIDIRDTSNDKFKMLMQVICKYFFDASISCEDIRNEMEYLIGTFFKVSNTHIISFRYQVMYDACVVAVDRLYPGNLWKECRLHCIHSDQMNNSSNGMIVLTKSNITVIVEDLMQQLDKKHFKEVLTNDMLQEKQIMDKLHEKMRLSFQSLLQGSDCEHGETFMFWCLRSANAMFVKYLVSEIEFDCNSRDIYGRTLLMYAAQFGNRKLLDFLLGKGADISVLDHDNRNVLHRACFNDNAEFVKYLVCEKRFDVHTRDKYGRTPLMIAVEFGCRNVFDLLVGKGADISVLDHDNINVLHRACFNDNAEFVKYLVCEKRFDVHTRDKYGRTPLMIAAKFDCRNVFDLLVGKGADISVLDNDNRNVLHRACFNDNAEFVKYLVCERRFDVHTRDKYGRTPLMIAAEFGCRNVFDLLVGRGADISVLDHDNINVLHRACFNDNAEFVKYLVCEKRFDVHTRDKYERTPLMIAAEFGCRNVFDLLLGEGADISVLDHDRNNVLHRACFNDNAEFVKYLVCERRFDVHTRDKYGRTPLMIAAQFGCRNVFDLLLGEGADISVLDHDNRNVLHRACFNDNAKFVKYLVFEKRFDVHTRDKYGRTPLMIAVEFGCRNVFDLLLGEGADISVLDQDNKNLIHRACFNDNAKFVKYLVFEKRFDVHTRDKYGRTPLMIAAEFGCRNVFDLLVGKGADISVLDHDNRNVLHRACFNDNAEFVKYLVCEKRFDVHTRDKYGRTSLMIAALFGCRNVFDLLVGEGADISVLDHDHKNVLHRTCFKNNAEFVKYLVCEKRFDVHTRDKYGRTPLMIAAEFGCRNVFDLLLGEGADISVLDHDHENVLHRACFKDNTEFVKYLVCEKRFDVHTRDKYGRTPLMYAALFGCRNVFHLLVGKGADISVLDHDNINVLHRACFNDNAEFVKYLVCEKRFDVHTRDKYGRTPLMIAAEFCCRNVFDLLLAEGADISVLDHDNGNVLHLACFNENAEFVQYLVCEKRFDVHTRNNNGNTPLMIAAQFGCRNVFDLLLGQGADISVLNHDNRNVLHRACLKDNAEFVQYLVCEKRFDVHTRDKYGRTPLMIAAEIGNRKVFDLLLGKGADISVLDHDNINALHLTCLNENAEFVQYLVCEKRFDVHTRDKYGRTPLMIAAPFGCRNVFDLLLGEGADISVLDHNNRNVLHLACFNENAEFVQYLVCEKRFDVHTRDKYGRTPLMIAAEFGCRNVFAILLGQGADISVLDHDNNTVLHRACYKDNAEFVKYLVCEKRFDVHTRDKYGRTPLMIAAEFGCRNVFDLLVGKGADISVLDHDNINVLHQACSNDNAEFVKYLVCEKRFDVHTRDKYGRTPLMIAAKFDCRNVFDLLVGKGADISVLDNENRNVLHRACFNDNAEFVKYLVCERRFDVHTRDKYGRTPLMIAAEFGCRNVFDLLVGKGADISVLDHDNINVLHRACFNDNAEFVKYLVCEKRFDVHTRDKYGRTPLMYAALFGCRKVLAFLKSQEEEA